MTWWWWAAIGAALGLSSLTVLPWFPLSAQPYEHDVKAGAAIYARNCATCHGAAGAGDGLSAAGLSTKPANLADGRLMSPLPDEVLTNVIRRGGPAEGLAPTMPAFARFLSDT